MLRDDPRDKRRDNVSENPDKTRYLVSVVLPALGFAYVFAATNGALSYLQNNTSAGTWGFWLFLTSSLFAFGFFILLAVLYRRRFETETLAKRGKEFSALVAHQLKGPIAQIVFALEVAEESLGQNDEVRELIARTGRSAREANDIINNLLNLSRIERGIVKQECSTVAVAELVKNVTYNLQKAAADKSVRIEARGNTGLVLATDTGKLAEALKNIVDNAVRYSPDGSAVVLDFGQDPAGEVVISVSDNGAGIAPEDQPHIFELAHEGSAKKFAGAGIGLYVSRMFVELLGGRITFKSSPAGTTFTITLPKESCKEDN